ncbi:heavy-metal-associated domain-containing protein [bacterium AH-315-C07]|nr:heavy-metal-associated domain-containing protein [bacterium AH-315-C07]
MFLFSFSTLFGQTDNSAQSETVKTVNIEVKGMTCQAGCADGIDAKFKQTDGVISSKTTFANSTSVIEYDPGKITEKEIAKIIKTKGFKATILEENNEDTKGKS